MLVTASARSLPAATLAVRGRDRRERHRDMPAQQIGQRGAGALVGNMHQRDAGGARKIFAGDVARGAGAGGAEIDLAGIGLGVGDQLGHGLGRERGIHHQRIRRIADHADRRKILARIVADILVERRSDRQRAGIAEQQRVAVGIALRHRLGADGAAGAGAVVDHDFFAEQFAHLVGNAAADDRGRAARRERDHQRDGAVRKGLRVGGAGCRGRARRRWRAECVPDAHARRLPDHFLVGCIVAERADVRNPASSTHSVIPGRCAASNPESRDSRCAIAHLRFDASHRPGMTAIYFHANTGCSSSATRVSRPASTSRNW